jgi:hypothetical protein
MALMWDRGRPSRVVGAEFLLVVGALMSCGGRSARHSAAEGTGGRGGTGGTASAAGAGVSSGGAGGTGGVLSPCGISTVRAEVFPPLVLLLDGSSRALSADVNGRPRWDGVKAGVLALASSLRDGSRFGVAVARETDESGLCSDPTLVLDAAPLDGEHRRRIEATLARANPGGSWAHASAFPEVVGGLEALGDELTTASIVAVGGGVRNDFPVCGAPPDASILVELGNAAYEAGTRGISTFGVGIDGSSEEFSLLVLLGSSSGTCSINLPESCVDDLSLQPDLGVALAEAFRERALREESSCTFPLQAIPSDRLLDPDGLKFTLTRGGVTVVVEQTIGPCSSGWRLSEDGTSVALCPDSCEAFRGDPSSTLRVAMACDGPPPRN